MQKVHWTQTLAGKKKMATIQRQAWHARKKRERTNGHAVTPVLKGRALARADIHDLARRGAEQRVAELEKEITRLKVFLGQAGDR